MGFISTLFSDPIFFFVILLAIITSLSFHEFAHAFAGYKLGDETAHRLGRLTLNPLAHIDFFGLFMMIFAGFGWAKPVPFDPRNLKSRRWGPVLVALAGPLSNILLAAIAAIVFRLVATSFEPSNALVVFLQYMVFVNLILAAFNVIPLPPLDGSKLLFAILDDARWEGLRHRLQVQGPMILIGIILLDRVANVHIFGAWFNLINGLAIHVFLGM